MRAFSRLGSCGLLLLLLACASSGGASSGSTPNTLTKADLLETNEETLYEAIRRLRPRWLRPRGGNLDGRTLAQVFVDGSPRGDVNALGQIRVIDVADVRFLSTIDAATRYGTLAAIGGAILVRMGADFSPRDDAVATVGSGSHALRRALRCLIFSTAVLAACSGDGAVSPSADTPSDADARFDVAVTLEPTSETSANVNLGDLDGDGDLDIVLAKGRHWQLLDVVLLNDGQGGFLRRWDVSDVADRTYTAVLADLDGDGDLDLVVGNDQPDEKPVYFNDGTGHFERAGTFGSSNWPTRNVTVTDFTGDGRPDIVVANRGGRANGTANYLCPNDGEGGFPSCTVLSEESATTIGAGDFNGDGFVDLVVPHRDGGQSFVYLNDGSGGFEESFPLGPSGTATRAVAVGDLNGDGRPDIVVGDDQQGGAFAYTNVGGGSFEGPVLLGALAVVAYSIAIADLDGDGEADVVLGNFEAPGTVLLNEGRGESFTALRFGDGRGVVYGIAIGDVDGDGRPDIVVARSGAPNTLYLN